MSQTPPSIVFDAERAAGYDQQFAALAPMREALHLTTRLALVHLQPHARVPCVGAGTGLELDLAQAFPGWHQTAVEPSAPMLALCREKIVANGLGDRCTLHEGYIESLPEQPAFDAATALVSDLQRAIAAISQKMLIHQLRQLEQDGTVARIVPAQVPPKVEYHLTSWGQSLCPALDELLTWAEKRPMPKRQRRSGTTAAGRDGGSKKR